MPYRAMLALKVGAAGVGAAAARLTLVTLDCRPFDILKSVSRVDAAVYSPAVLRLRGQPPAHCPTANSTANVKVARPIFE
jgi:hypothetical protein